MFAIRQAFAVPQAQSQVRLYATRPSRGGGISSHSTYHPKGYGVSEGLKRARRPFAVRNAIIGVTLCTMAVNLYLYSIYKIKQDDFSDIGVSNEQQAPVTFGKLDETADHTPSPSSVPSVTEAPQTAGKRLV